MAAEVELKLTIDPASLAQVREHPALAALLSGRARTSKDVSTYYDTRSGELRKAGVALRMRRSGHRWLQTVKGAGDRVGALHRRPEYEWAMRTSRIDPRKLSTTPWRGVFEATAGRLRPIFVTEVDRTAQPLVFDDGTRATLCLDAGEIRAGRKRAPLNEIEIELVQGEPRQLHQLALSLAADLPVAMARTSKAERGYALASPAPREPVHAGKLALDTGVSVGEALAHFGSDCLEQIGANAQCIAAGVDGEFVHQARVGVRRLRSLLRLVAGLIGAETVAPIVRDLRWFSTTLGAARDWDVFAKETLAAVGRALKHSRSRRDVGIVRGRILSRPAPRPRRRDCSVCCSPWARCSRRWNRPPPIRRCVRRREAWRKTPSNGALDGSTSAASICSGYPPPSATRPGSRPRSFATSRKFSRRFFPAPAPKTISPLSVSCRGRWAI
jgi:triphosphatase